MDDLSGPKSRNPQGLWIQATRFTRAANAFAPDEYFSQTTNTYYEESYGDQADRSIFERKKKNRPLPQPRPTAADQAYHFKPSQFGGQNASYYNSLPASPPGQTNAQYHGYQGQAAQNPQAGSPHQTSYSPPPPPPSTATYNTHQQGYGGPQTPINSSPPLGSPNSQYSLPLHQSNIQQQSYGGNSYQSPSSSPCVGLASFSPSN
jgi:hypothetical protein